MKKHIHTSHLIFLLLILFVTTFNLAPLTATAAITSASITSGLSSPYIFNDSPAHIYIPSINLYTHIQGVGIDKKGNMDVPSGRTNNVGWYEKGVLPGNIGTAVLDAHVTAAFKNLKNVPVGADIYIVTEHGRWMHFRVNKSKVYSMDNLKPSTLFAQTNSKQINLITCAGKNLGNGEATHRLIVSAELV